MEIRLVRGRKLQSGKVAVMRGPMLFTYNPNRQTPPLQAEKVKFDWNSLTGPVPDKTVRPAGVATQIRGWGPKSDPEKPADVSLLLTEFADPAGAAAYFSTGDPKIGVDDELSTSPPTGGK